MNIFKKIVTSFIQVLFFSLLFLSDSYGQIDIFEDALKTVDKLNSVLLDMTKLTDEEENNVGIELDKYILKDYKQGKSNKYNVKSIFDKIKKNAKRKKIKYEVKVLKSDDVNAFAIAGGKTYVLTGLTNFVESEDELAFVIAHEIAHNELMHCVKRVQYSVQASKIEPALGEVVQIAYSVYNIPYSKYDEYAADKLGVELMEKAGYKVEGAIQFFTKLKKLEEKYGKEKRDALNDFISSHPTADDRKERISNKKGKK